MRRNRKRQGKEEKHGKEKGKIVTDQLFFMPLENPTQY
jgi:hypothetical protein